MSAPRRPDPASDGERRKAEGMAAAAEHAGRAHALRFKVAFLAAMLDQPTGAATADAAAAGDRLCGEYPRKGRWVGPAVSDLRRAGLIEAARDPSGEYVLAGLSRRATRHRGLAVLWRLTDRPAAVRHLHALRAALRGLPHEPQQRGLFDHPGQ